MCNTHCIEAVYFNFVIGAVIVLRWLWSWLPHVLLEASNIRTSWGIVELSLVSGYFPPQVIRGDDSNFFFDYYYYFTLLVLLSIVTSMLLNYVLLSVNWYFVSLEINQCHVVSFTFVLLSFSSDTVSLKKLFPAFQFITRWWNSGKELTKPNADTFGFLPCQVTTEFWICFIQC